MSLKRQFTEVHQNTPKTMAGGYPYGYPVAFFEKSGKLRQKIFALIKKNQIFRDKFFLNRNRIDMSYSKNKL